MDDLDRPETSWESNDDNESAWSARLVMQIEQQGPSLFRLAYGIVRDAATAEDVCQEAFTRAWQHRGSIRDAGSLGGWLVRVVINQSVQVLRRRKTADGAIAAQALSLQPARRPDQELELKDTVMTALAELPERTQQVVVLRLMQGLSGNEVKQILGCSASEVSRHLHAGIDSLRAALKES
jgi:RNA polymerase sigma factor (sigma-70 family)